jgi:hypothetical protein
MNFLRRTTSMFRGPYFSHPLAPVCLLALAGFVFGSAVPAQAQDEPGASPKETEAEKRGYFAVGVNAIDLAPLNDRLSANGYPTFSTELLSISGGQYRVVADRLVLGAELTGLLTPNQGFQGRDVFVGGGYGLFSLGYLIQPASRFRAYPLAGIGAGGLLLSIGDDGAEEFDDVLEDPNRSATLSKGSILVSLGAGLEYQFGQPGGDGVRLGLRGGYLLSVLDSDWQLDQDRLSGGPDATMQGPFLRLTVGGVGSVLKHMRDASDEDKE